MNGDELALATVEETDSGSKVLQNAESWRGFLVHRR